MRVDLVNRPILRNDDKSGLFEARRDHSLSAEAARDARQIDPLVIVGDRNTQRERGRAAPAVRREQGDFVDVVGIRVDRSIEIGGRNEGKRAAGQGKGGPFAAFRRSG
jgi:hypothetical protein